MIKVIKPGVTARKDKIRKFVCQNCGCVFEADDRDYEFVADHGHCELYLKSKCPTCHLAVYLSGWGTNV